MNEWRSKAVSMKTTKMTDVDKWCNSNAINMNRESLFIDGYTDKKGTTWNGKTMKYDGRYT